MSQGLYFVHIQNVLKWAVYSHAETSRCCLLYVQCKSTNPVLWISLCELSSMPAIDFLEFFFQRLSCLKYTGSNSNKKLVLIIYTSIFLPVSYRRQRNSWYICCRKSVNRTLVHSAYILHTFTVLHSHFATTIHCKLSRTKFLDQITKHAKVMYLWMCSGTRI